MRTPSEHRPESGLAAPPAYAAPSVGAVLQEFLRDRSPGAPALSGDDTLNAYRQVAHVLSLTQDGLFEEDRAAGGFPIRRFNLLAGAYREAGETDAEARALWDIREQHLAARLEADYRTENSTFDQAGFDELSLLASGVMRESHARLTALVAAIDAVEP